MKIHDGAPSKSRGPDVYRSGKTMKQEPVEAPQIPRNSGKSLLKNIETPIDADSMLNTLNEVAGDANVAGTSSVLDPLFDPSQVSLKWKSKHSRYSMKLILILAVKRNPRRWTFLLRGQNGRAGKRRRPDSDKIQSKAHEWHSAIELGHRLHESLGQRAKRPGLAEGFAARWQLSVGSKSVAGGESE